MSSGSGSSDAASGTSSSRCQPARTGSRARRRCPSTREQPLGDETLHVGPREAGGVGHEAIDPAACRSLGHRQRTVLAHATRVAPLRRPEPLRSPSRAAAKSTRMPTKTAASEMFQAYQRMSPKPMSTKSMTWPRRTRSMRLPMAPPSRSPRPAATSIPAAAPWRHSNQVMPTMTSSESTAMIGAMASKTPEDGPVVVGLGDAHELPDAAPVGPPGSPAGMAREATSKEASTQSLVAWSRRTTAPARPRKSVQRRRRCGPDSGLVRGSGEASASATQVLQGDAHLARLQCHGATWPRQPGAGCQPDLVGEGVASPPPPGGMPAAPARSAGPSRKRRMRASSVSSACLRRSCTARVSSRASPSARSSGVSSVSMTTTMPSSWATAVPGRGVARISTSSGKRRTPPSSTLPSSW